MVNQPTHGESANSDRYVAGLLIGVIFVVSALAGVLLAAIVWPPARLMVSGVLDYLFALSATQVYWYITRSAGLMAYVLLWFSTVWGISVTSKALDPVLNRQTAYSFHEFLSLLALTFVALHMVVLPLDRNEPFSLLQVFVPFINQYRPFWVGVGVIATYMALAATITFYLRGRIGHKKFRAVHYVTYLAFFGAAIHGLMAGTDSPLTVTRIMYLGTTLSVVFLTVYRILTTMPEARRATTKAE
jgi:methionine sulfoxide reductase heme-binding subunit